MIGLKPVAFEDDVLSFQQPYRAGIYARGDTFLARNRPLAEDQARTLDGDLVDHLFRGMDYVRFDETLGTESSLAQEIFRLFLIACLLLLFGEALLCLPSRTSAEATKAAKAASQGGQPT